MDRILVATIVICVALFVALGYVVMRVSTDARNACVASGRTYVIDHYVTTYIAVKSGSTVIMMPSESPVYACKE